MTGPTKRKPRRPRSRESSVASGLDTGIPEREFEAVHDRLPVDSRPEVAVQACIRLPQPEDRPSILAERVHLEAVADDARVGEGARLGGRRRSVRCARHRSRRTRPDSRRVGAGSWPMTGRPGRPPGTASRTGGAHRGAAGPTHRRGTRPSPGRPRPTRSGRGRRSSSRSQPDRVRRGRLSRACGHRTRGGAGTLHRGCPGRGPEG